MLLRCKDCGATFEDDELVAEDVCWEDYYGVGSMFPNKNYGTIDTCPCCGSDDYEEVEEDFEDD